MPSRRMERSEISTMWGKLIIAPLVLSAGTPATATAGDLWLAAEGVNSMSVSSDASTLNCTRGQCSIWEETRYAAAQVDGVASLRDLALYDCAGDRTRTKIEIKLGADGRVLKTVTAEDPWHPVQTGSVGATTLAFACHFQVANADDIRSGAFDAEGHHFVRSAPAKQVNVALATELAGDRRSRYAVQVAASVAEGEARKAALSFESKYQSEIEAGLELKVAPATPGRVRVFRVLVEGFGSERQAHVFCDMLKAGGDDCIVRSNVRIASER